MVTTAGVKAQLIPTGRSEHENAIGVETFPEVEVTVIAVLAKVPRLIFSEASAALRLITDGFAVGVNGGGVDTGGFVAGGSDTGGFEAVVVVPH